MADQAVGFVTRGGGQGGGMRNGTQAPRRWCHAAGDEGKHAARAHAALPSRSDPRIQERSEEAAAASDGDSTRNPMSFFPLGYEFGLIFRSVDLLMSTKSYPLGLWI